MKISNEDVKAATHWADWLESIGDADPKIADMLDPIADAARAIADWVKAGTPVNWWMRHKATIADAISAINKIEEAYTIAKANQPLSLEVEKFTGLVIGFRDHLRAILANDNPTFEDLLFNYGEEDSSMRDAALRLWSLTHGHVYDSTEEA